MALGKGGSALLVVGVEVGLVVGSVDKLAVGVVVGEIDIGLAGCQLLASFSGAFGEVHHLFL